MCAGGGGARAQTCQTAHSQSTRPTSAAIRAMRVVMIEWHTPPGGRASSGTEAAVSRAQPTNSHAGASWELPSKIVEAQPSALHDHLQRFDDSARSFALGRCRCYARPCECLPLRATDARLLRCTRCSARRPFASGVTLYPGPRCGEYKKEQYAAAPLRGVKKGRICARCALAGARSRRSLSTFTTNRSTTLSLLF
jgi:hypothetical protein